MRVIAGFLKGKKINTLDGMDITRPTSDRAKEALMNIIQAKLQKNNMTWADVVAVDCFAGSGAVGIEFLSRGARKVYFIENNHQALRIIRSNISDLKGAILLKQDATQKIKISEKINLLFMDPPYQTDLGMLVLKKKLPLAENAIIILEVEKGQQVALPDDFYIDEERNYGRNQFLFIYPKRLTK